MNRRCYADSDYAYWVNSRDGRLFDELLRQVPAILAALAVVLPTLWACELLRYKRQTPGLYTSQLSRCVAEVCFPPSSRLPGRVTRSMPPQCDAASGDDPRGAELQPGYLRRRAGEKFEET